MVINKWSKQEKKKKALDVVFLCIHCSRALLEEKSENYVIILKEETAPGLKTIV